MNKRDLIAKNNYDICCGDYKTLKGRVEKNKIKIIIIRLTRLYKRMYNKHMDSLFYGNQTSDKKIGLEKFIGN